MKFATLIALVAIAHAQDEEEAAEVETLEAGADCSAEGSVCGEGLCCGTATEALAEDAEEGTEAATKTVCNDSASAEFVDEEDPDVAYTFACNTEAGAAKMVASAAALLAVAYLQ
jgi:hypothetical protein